MELSRRGFLGGLLAVVSAPAIVRIENLMVLPAPKAVILLEDLCDFAPVNIDFVRGNNLLTINQITREAVRLFMNSNAFIKSLDGQYDHEFAVAGALIGNTLRIGLPTDFAMVQGHQFT